MGEGCGCLSGSKSKRGKGRKGERENVFYTFVILRAISCGMSGMSTRFTVAVLFLQTPTTVATDSVNGVNDGNKSRDERDKVEDRRYRYTSGTKGA